MSKVYLFFKTIILDAILVFLLVPAHFIYLAIRYGPKLANLILAFSPILIVSIVLLYLINIVYTMLKIIYDDLNVFDKTRWFSIWLVIHTLFYSYWELTMDDMPTMYYWEWVVSTVVYLGYLIYVHHTVYTKLQISQS